MYDRRVSTSSSVFGLPYLWPCLLTIVVFVQPTLGQTDKEQNFRSIRRSIESQFQSELQNLIQQCDEASREVEAKSISKFVVDRDPQRQYIFLPPENEVDADRFTDLNEKIKIDLNALLEEHAAKLFKLAKQEAETGNAAWAFQLFNEILFYQPDHRETRQILGHRITGSDQETWRVKSDRLKVKLATKREKDMGWPAKSYWTGSTTHFYIVSTAGEEQTRQLASKLERWHDVWRQVFFEYYNSQKNLKRWIQGTSKPTKSGRKFKVVFFADRNQYISTLGDSIPGIEVSTGYYNDAEKKSYFFASDDKTIQDTWRHELTHQMFQESQRSVRSPFQDQFLWLGEGIAMYFESLVNHGDYVTLGGFETRRLQYARLRYLKERFRVPLEPLSGMSIRQFQTQQEVAKIYSQSAGVTHFLMNAAEAKYQRPLIEFLTLIYRGKLKPGSFETLLGTSFTEIENGYHAFLKIDESQLRYLDSRSISKELALIGIRLKEHSMSKFTGGGRFDWLDLSACYARGSRLKFLKTCDYIDSLFLTGAKVDQKTAEILAASPIANIDLSGSNLKDEGLIALAESRTLKTINVVESGVTSHGIKALGSLRPDIKLLSNFNRDER